VRLPEPPLLLITDRRQTQQPLLTVVRSALVAGCRWISVREKDLAADEQVMLVQTLLPIALRHRSHVSLHGAATLAKVARVNGVHLSAGSDPFIARKLLGTDTLIGVSIHTATEAETIDPGVVDYAIAGPAFETPSKPGYGPAIGPKGLAEIAGAARVPIIAVGGITAKRAAEVLAVGPIGIAVMGAVMRAADPSRQIKALLAVVAGTRS